MIENIIKRVESGEYRFTIHALERCVERSISPIEIKEAILSGEIIEEYPQDKYGAKLSYAGNYKKGENITCTMFN